MRLLADTSVWISHLRSTNHRVVGLLRQGVVIGHPLVLGELACGNLRDRRGFIADYRRLHHAVVATHDEVLTVIEQRQLMGSGLGIVDLHLLGATLVTPGALLWSEDQRLAKAAADLGIAYG